MLGYFPTPYPDELFHSICARFVKRTGLSSAFLRTELLGFSTRYHSLEFPGRSTYFSDNLRWAGIFHEEDVIQKHTLLPMYIPFLNRDGQEKVKLSISNYSRVYRTHSLLGKLSRSIPKIQLLRFCPECLLCDREQYGEAYWHRVHQVQGNQVCPIHNTFFSN